MKKLSKEIKKGNKLVYGFHWRMFFRILVKKYYWRINWDEALKQTHEFKGNKIDLFINKKDKEFPFIDMKVQGHKKEVEDKIKEEVKKEMAKAVGAMAGAGVI